jgi:hypothetical protein
MLSYLTTCRQLPTQGLSIDRLVSLGTDMANSTGKSEEVAKSGGRLPGASRKTPPIAQIARRLGRAIPTEELRLLPKDLSDQIDHYVYGTPKR